jgi:Na+-driven multidrug efflux pump
VLGVVLAIPGLLFPQRILELMGAEPAVVAEGTNYMRIMLGSNVIILLLFGINAIFRGAGNAMMALWSLWLANGINIVLDPLLIFGIGPFPEMGVTGAAVATAIGRSAGVGLQLYYLFRVGERITLLGVPLRFDPPVLWNIVKVSAGGVAQFVIASASWVFLVRIVSAFGSAAVAGYTVAVRIIIFSLLPSWGMANAASTLVGQNLVAVAIFFWGAAPWLMGFFTQDPVVADHGISALRIICLGYFFYGYGMVLAQAFNGAGDTLTPTWMNVVCFWLIEIPLAWTLARVLQWGPEGVFASIAISESLLAVLSGYLFKRGKWRTVQV